MRTYLLMAVRNLLQARRRTLLLSAGLGIVSLFLMLMLSLSQGVTDTMFESSTMLWTGHVNVGGWFKPKHGEALPLVRESARLRRLVIENTPELAHVVERVRGWARIVSTKTSFYAGINGIDVANEQDFVARLKLAEERTYKRGGLARAVGSVADLAEPNTIMLFAAQAKRLKVGVGDILTLSAELGGGTTNTFDVRVVAVAQDMGFMSSSAAYVSDTTLRGIYQWDDDVTGAIHLYLRDPAQSGKIMERLRRVIAAEGFTVMDHDPQPFYMKFESVAGEDWTGQRIDVTTWEDEADQMKWAIAAIDSVSALVVGVMMIIIVIGIINTMHISVRERTEEIGTLRALGMRRARVLRLVLLESTILGGVSAALGGALGALIAGGLGKAAIPIPVAALNAVLMSDTLRLSVRPGQWVAVVAGFALTTAVASLWPALRAARMKPVTAIHRTD